MRWLFSTNNSGKILKRVSKALKLRREQKRAITSATKKSYNKHCKTFAEAENERLLGILCNSKKSLQSYKSLGLDDKVRFIDEKSMSCIRELDEEYKRVCDDWRSDRYTSDFYNPTYPGCWTDISWLKNLAVRFPNHNDRVIVNLEGGRRALICPTKELEQLGKLYHIRSQIDDLRGLANKEVLKLKYEELSSKGQLHVIAVHNPVAISSLCHDERSYESKNVGRACSATVTWCGDRDYSTPSELYGGQVFGVTLDPEKMKVYNAEFFAAGTFGVAKKESDLHVLSDRRGSVSKHPKKKGHIRDGNNVVDISRWNAVDKTWHAEPSIATVAGNVWWRYNRDRAKGANKRGQKRYGGDGKMQYNEILFDTKDKDLSSAQNPVKTLMMNLPISSDAQSLLRSYKSSLRGAVGMVKEQDLQSFLFLLETKDLCLSVYRPNENGATEMLQFDNDVAIEIVGSVIASHAEDNVSISVSDFCKKLQDRQQEKMLAIQGLVRDLYTQNGAATKMIDDRFGTKGGKKDDLDVIRFNGKEYLVDKENQRVMTGDKASISTRELEKLRVDFNFFQGSMEYERELVSNPATTTHMPVGSSMVGIAYVNETML